MAAVAGEEASSSSGPETTTMTTLKKRHNKSPIATGTNSSNETTDDDGNDKYNKSNNRKVTSSSSQQQRPSCFFLNRRFISLLGGIGGMVDFTIYGKPPTWVDISLPPGTTPQPDPPKLDLIRIISILSGYTIVFSPNLVWFAIAALIYVLFPYNIESYDDDGSSSWSHFQWYVTRATLNTTVMLLYYGFWHITLYIINCGAKRPFAQGRTYKLSKTIHNVWYCFLGVLQWTAWEMIMVHLYATNRIGYQKDSEIFSSPDQFIKFGLAAVSVPVFREVQFFFAHRFIHLRCLYKYVHQLHHRNSDVEPFSGLCMTPVEHLYYISSIAPSLYWHASPFHFLWNGMHLVLSPGASHSGWEDHWHSDQFHVAHHRYFECNYGTPGFPLDHWFGSFRETMAPQTKSYKGDAVECISQNGPTIIQARSDSKSTLWGLPSWDQMLYYALTAVGLPLLTMYYVTYVRDHTNNNDDNDTLLLFPTASLAAFIVSIGPLILATILSIVTANPPIASWSKLRYAMLYPQHNEPILGKFSVGLLMGFLLSIMPTYHFFHSLFVHDPNQTAYNLIWVGVGGSK